jgi:hypothetical protein
MYMCTLLTQNICLICHTQVLELRDNQIGDAGLAALAKAVESGALSKLNRLIIDSPSAEVEALCSSKSIKLNTF